MPDDQLDKSKTQKPMIFEMIPFTFTIISGRSGSLKALKFLSFFQAAQILWPSIAISGHVHQGVVETRTALGDVQPEHGRSLHSAHFSRFDLQMPQQMHLNLQGIHRQGQKDETDETSTYGSHMGSAAVSFLRRLAHFRPKRVDRRTLEPLPKNVPK